MRPASVDTLLGSWATDESQADELVQTRVAAPLPRILALPGREIVRVRVLPHSSPFARDEVRTTVRSLGLEHRRLASPEWEISLLHLPTLLGVTAWSKSRTEPTLSLLRSYLRASLEARAPEPETSVALRRRYTLGPTPHVRDVVSGVRTARLDEVLAGAIERFAMADPGEPSDASEGASEAAD